MKTYLKKRIPEYIKLMIVLIWLQSCASITPVNLSVRQGLKPVSMTSNINKEYNFIKHFRVKQKVPFLFLVRVSPYGGAVDINELLAAELYSSQADAVVNLSIKGEAAIQDVFLPVGLGLLGGLVFPPFFMFMSFPLYQDLKTYEVEGDLVKYVDQSPVPDKTKEPFDPLTGFPAQKQKIKYDPQTGQPVKEQ